MKFNASIVTISTFYVLRSFSECQRFLSTDYFAYSVKFTTIKSNVRYVEFYSESVYIYAIFFFFFFFLFSDNRIFNLLLYRFDYIKIPDVEFIWVFALKKKITTHRFREHLCKKRRRKIKIEECWNRKQKWFRMHLFESSLSCCSPPLHLFLSLSSICFSFFFLADFELPPPTSVSYTTSNAEKKIVYSEQKTFFSAH